MPPRHVAVLGGGLTGLTAAFHLSRRFPSSTISVIDSSERFGGWVKSSRVHVRDENGHEANILVEAGPRTLKTNSDAVLELIHLLDLSTSLIVTPKTSPAAKNRFLYLAPSDNQAPSGLVQLPSSIASLVRSPIGRKLLLPAVVAEPFRLQNRSRDLHGQVAEDESFDAFCTRRFGARFARAMGSALVHGIYAADSRKLSVRAAFPSLWNSERRGRGSVVRGMLRGMFDPPTATTSQAGKYELGAVKEALRDASVFSFRNGLEEITNALLARLKQQTNVRILTGTGVQSVTYDKLLHEFALDLQTGGGTANESFSHLVSALPLPALGRVLQNNNPPLPLPASQASSVMVYSFIFPPTPTPIHPAGFGYLIPRPSQDYESAPHGMLGVVFDSCSLSAQDEGDSGFTKLTVMLGGPYPAWTREVPVDQILHNLSRQLGVALPQPVHVSRHMQQDCIPVPGPGHLQRVEKLRNALRSDWEGKLDVIGAGVGGVSFGDCVRQGREAGASWS